MTESNNKKQGVDRDWLKKLLQKHRHDNSNNTSVELAKQELVEKFPEKALVVAPMVDASDLPFRLLCRQYGCNLAYTPMIHARMFCLREKYRNAFFDLSLGTLPQDRPLVAQFCGSSLDHVVEAALLIEPHVDAIDINCGCPQNIARRGTYGAYLLEQPDLLLSLVRKLVSVLSKPLCVKVRLLTSGVEDSLKLYQKFLDAGISLLTIHGRNRMQKQSLTGAADWDAIQRAVELLGDRIPILANGSISNAAEAQACLDYTQADGVMVSEALLEYPPMFLNLKKRISRVQLAREYLDLATKHPPNLGGQASNPLKCVRAHLHRFLHADLQQYVEVRDLLVHAQSMDDLYNAINRLQEIHNQHGHDVQSEQLSWYVRHRKKTTEEEKKEETEITTKQETKEEDDMSNYFQDASNLFQDEW